MLLSIPDYDCQSEADVEQKFIYPLLTHLSFLEIPSKAILTKKSLSSMPFVEKSTLPRNYIPDYIISFFGLPICIIEAKEPDTSIDLAIKEARIYGQTLNQNFPTGINPVRFAVGCNGRQLSVSPVDSIDAVTFSISDLLIGTDAVARLRDLIGSKRLSEEARKAKKAVSGAAYTRPIRRLPAQMFVDRVRPNSLAQYLNPIYEMFFRADDPEKIQLILDQAYVDTRELREYDNVLHSLLRQVERKLDNYQPIQTDRSREYTLTPEIARYESDAGAEGRLHLIIGSRGSGKSLFIARFFSHLLPDRLKDRAAWCVVDFNRAPSTIDNIEDYICDRFVEDVQNLRFDWFELESLNRIFSTELKRLNKGALSVIQDKSERERLISNELFKLSSDRRTLALRLARYLTETMHRPLIIAFDNVDRRESDQQLKIFQAAQWFRRETRAFSLLTLRDVTFERYKNEPPLDAFAQINNFYIRPPRFSLVLQKRLALAIEYGLKDLEEIEQSTSSGLRIRYSKDQLGLFLQNVYDALFVGENQVGRIVDALAERNVRDALGMFARILASGHFNADEVIGIGLGAGTKIEHELLIKILMRADYRLYSDDVGFIHNIFWSSSDHFTGNLFLTPEILGFFAQDSASGSDKIAGYWRVEELLADLTGMGFEESEIRDGVAALLKWKMLAFDGEETDSPQDRDRIKITPSGFIHLKAMPYFIEYLSAVSVLCALRDDVARRIADGWEVAARLPDLDYSHKHQVAEIFADYLVREKSRLDTQNPLFRGRCREAERIIKAATHAINIGAPQARREREQNKAKAIERKKSMPKSGHRPISPQKPRR